MPEEKIVVLMGSPRDLHFASKIKGFLKKEGFPVKCVYNVASAHKTPEKLLNDLKEYEESGDSIVYITVAGLSDALYVRLLLVLQTRTSMGALRCFLPLQCRRGYLLLTLLSQKMLRL